MIAVVRLKSGVSLAGLSPAGIRLLAAVDNCCRIVCHDLTLTCTTGGHATNDPHTRGDALDIRTRDLDDQVVVWLIDLLQDQLGHAFTVLYEAPIRPQGELGTLTSVNASASGPHLHVQLRKGFGVFPPVVPDALPQ